MLWGFTHTEVGAYLFSQAASSQVSWAQMGLTAVFGMGTGVPHRHRHRLW